MTIEQDILNLTQAVADYGAQHQTKMDALEATRAATQAVADGILDTGPSSTVVANIDAVNGDDANNGATSSTKIKTWARLMELAQPGRHLAVNVFSDLDIDSFAFFDNGPHKFSFFGRNDSNTAYQNRTFNILDSVNVTDRCGGFVCDNQFGVYIKSINFNINTTKNYSFLESRSGTLTGRLIDPVVTRVGTGNAALIGAYDGAFTHLTWSNHTFGAGAPGYIYYSVAAGVDPNTRPSIITNITSG